MNQLKNYDAKSFKEHLKDNGIFYTDPKLAAMMKEIAYKYIKDIKEVYDPTCGRGNLLSVFDDNVIKYGQDINESELEVARNNIPNFIGQAGNTLFDPKFLDKKFDVIVGNPPFSIKWLKSDKEDKKEANKEIKEIQQKLLEDIRFKEVGVLPPNSYGDFAFLLHILHYLSNDGVAIVLEFPGILYRKNAEHKIRKWIIEQNYIDTVRMIPSGYFVDTNINVVLIIFRKNKTNTDIKFINEEGLENTVTLETIIENDYNLSASTYIERPDNKIEFDIIKRTEDDLDRSIKSFKSMFEMDLFSAYMIDNKNDLIKYHRLMLIKFDKLLEIVKESLLKFKSGLEKLESEGKA